MRAQLIMAVVVASFHCRLLDRSVHPLDLAIGPRMVWLGQAVFDPICFADHVEAHLPRVCCVPVSGLLGELDDVVSQDRVDADMGLPSNRRSRNSQAVLRSALSTSCVTANLLVRSMPTKR